MKIVFMGTPEFAVPSLDALVRNHHSVVLAVSQQDRPRDRGRQVKPTPVKAYALEAGIPVLQPERLNRQPEMAAIIRSYSPDLIVTCAFGQILPAEVLSIPVYGTINVHGSLLPALRGAAPINWSIINGDKQTGITTMITDIGLDTGDMLLKEIVDIPDDMTSGELYDIMSIIGAATLVKTIRELEAGTLRKHSQNNALASLAPRLSKQSGRINWGKPAWDIHNLIRGTDPWPGAFTSYKGKVLRIVKSVSPGRPTEPLDANAKVGAHVPNCIKRNDASHKFHGSHKTEVADESNLFSHEKGSLGHEKDSTVRDSERQNPPAGTILELDSSGLLVQTLDKALLITEIQMPSSRKMSVAEWLNGHTIEEGAILGEET